ncbi:MAG: hypothetical protein ACI9MD_001687, partial [Psychrobacter glaciei]
VIRLGLEPKNAYQRDADKHFFMLDTDLLSAKLLAFFGKKAIQAIHRIF